MIRVTESLLAQRAYRLSLALVDDPLKSSESCPVLRYVPGMAEPWSVSVAARPARVRGRWFVRRGTTPLGALERLVNDLHRECARRDLDAQQILLEAKLASAV